MEALPHDVVALFALAFMLGIKHGLDPDHLATIDGLTRFNASSSPWLAKWAGVLFSVGHGIMVTTVAGLIALLPGRVSIPGWLEGFGAVISILTLLALGLLNLYAAFNRQHVIAQPVGLKNWMRIQTGHPVIVLGIGALFALSFDTMSNAAFFSLAATQVSGELYAFALGIVFTGGMIVSDGVNGMLTARLIRHANARAVTASRIMSFTIGSVSLLVALMGISKLFLPALSANIEQYGIWPGMAVFVWVVAGFATSLYIVRLSTIANRSAKN